MKYNQRKEHIIIESMYAGAEIRMELYEIIHSIIIITTLLTANPDQEQSSTFSELCKRP